METVSLIDCIVSNNIRALVANSLNSDISVNMINSTESTRVHCKGPLVQKTFSENKKLHNVSLSNVKTYSLT